MQEPDDDKLAAVTSSTIAAAVGDTSPMTVSADAALLLAQQHQQQQNEAASAAGISCTDKTSTFANCQVNYWIHNADGHACECYQTHQGNQTGESPLPLLDCLLSAKHLHSVRANDSDFAILYQPLHTILPASMVTYHHFITHTHFHPTILILSLNKTIMASLPHEPAMAGCILDSEWCLVQNFSEWMPFFMATKEVSHQISSVLQPLSDS